MFCFMDEDPEISLEDSDPVYEVSWGALWHGASDSFCFYYDKGRFYVRTPYEEEITGPFETALEAALAHYGALKLDHDEEHGSIQAIHYSSELDPDFRKLIPRSLEKQLFGIITGQDKVFDDFYWCEVKPGRLFHDLFHDESGKALKGFFDAQREGDFRKIASAKAALSKLLRKCKAFDHVVTDDAARFVSNYDSFLMKIPLEATGPMSRHRSEWVRLCLPRIIGKKTVVTAIPIENPRDLIDDLKPAENGA